MFCTKCGLEVDEKTLNYCKACGQIIDHGDILPKWKYRGFVSTKPTLPSTQIPPFLMKLLGFIGAGFLTGFIIYALQPR